MTTSIIVAALHKSHNNKPSALQQARNIELINHIEQKVNNELDKNILTIYWLNLMLVLVVDYHRASVIIEQKNKNLETKSEVLTIEWDVIKPEAEEISEGAYSN